MSDLRTARRNFYPGWLGSTDFLPSLSSKPANEGVDYSKQVKICNRLTGVTSDSCCTGVTPNSCTISMSPVIKEVSVIEVDDETMD